MTMPGMHDDRPSRPKVYAGQLWSGGFATAVVAGLVALVGVLASRWLLGIPILAPQREGAYGDAHTTGLVLAAAGVAVIATLIAHLLLLTTPRPRSFLGWIIGLVTVVAVLFPFSTGAPLAQKIATAVVNLAIGVAIGSLLNGVAARSIRPPRDAVAYPPEADDYPTRTRADDYPTREYPAEPREYPAGRRHRSGGYGPMGGDPDR